MDKVFVATLGHPSRVAIALAFARAAAAASPPKVKTKGVRKLSSRRK
jgi:hypothetical protein